MTIDSTHSTQFRHALVAALNSNPSSIDFKKLVADSDVSRADADLVAQKLLAQLIRKSLEDGVISDPEQRKLDRLAQLLAIPNDTAGDLFARVGKSVLRKELSEAQADGVITTAENLQLQQLRTTLGLRAVPANLLTQNRPETTQTPITGGGFEDQREAQNQYRWNLKRQEYQQW